MKNKNIAGEKLVSFGAIRTNERARTLRNPNESRLIADFIKCSEYRHGVGYFENDAEAVSCALTMSKNQVKKYRRHGIVPVAFIKYLKQKKLILEDVWLPDHERSIHGLLDLLWNARDRRTGNFSEGDALRQILLLEIHPELKKASGSSEGFWRWVEREGKLKGLKGPGGTSKMPGY